MRIWKRIGKSFACLVSLAAAATLCFGADRVPPAIRAPRSSPPNCEIKAGSPTQPCPTTATGICSLSVPMALAAGTSPRLPNTTNWAYDFRPMDKNPVSPPAKTTKFNPR